MKHKILFFAFLTVTLFVATSCNTDPQPCFNIKPNPVTVGQSVKFNNCSLYAKTWDWDFGDGTGSNEKSPSHVYDSAGVYKVTLIATKKNGTASTPYAQNVTVN